MTQEVLKRDQSKQPFDSEKLKSSIEKSAKDAGLSEEKITEVVNQVSAKALELIEGKEEVSAALLRDTILSELDSIEPSVSEAWRKYDKEKKGL